MNRNYTTEALAQHDSFCLDSALSDVYENRAEQGQCPTEREALDEAAGYLVEGLSSCTCHTAENGWEGWEAHKPGVCRCGCGEATKSFYRPGHDARHLSAVVADCNPENQLVSRNLGVVLAALPTEALVRKALARLG